MSISPALSSADALQRRAADPAASVWVAASAGTGKTKVLTDRVLNLLIANTSPDSILCLTFTRAAAAEMAERIAHRLADWAVIGEKPLFDDLGKLLGRTPVQDEISRARKLFAQVLDVPGGMRIETVHAFCSLSFCRAISPFFDAIILAIPIFLSNSIIILRENFSPSATQNV